LHAWWRFAAAFGVVEVPKDESATANCDGDQADGAIEHAGGQQEIRRADHFLPGRTALALFESVLHQSLRSAFLFRLHPLVVFLVELDRIWVAVLVVVLLRFDGRRLWSKNGFAARAFELLPRRQRLIAFQNRFARWAGVLRHGRVSIQSQ